MRPPAALRVSIRWRRCGTIDWGKPKQALPERENSDDSFHTLSAERHAGLRRAAEKMPEDAYAFRITPDNQTWAEHVAHVATSAMGSCARVKGEQKQANLGSNSKADLSAALKAGFDECDAAWDTVTDANMAEMVGAGRGQATRLGTMIRNTVHISEVYGAMTAYMRLKGVVPPSSEGGRGGG